jgi:hypothetical protein
MIRITRRTDGRHALHRNKAGLSRGKFEGGILPFARRELCTGAG